MPLTQPVPVRDARGRAGVIEIAPTAAGTQHPQDAGQEVKIGVVQSICYGSGIARRQARAAGLHRHQEATQIGSDNLLMPR